MHRRFTTLLLSSLAFLPATALACPPEYYPSISRETYASDFTIVGVLAAFFVIAVIGRWGASLDRRLAVLAGGVIAGTGLGLFLRTTEGFEMTTSFGMSWIAAGLLGIALCIDVDEETTFGVRFWRAALLGTAFGAVLNGVLDLLIRAI